MEYKVSQDEPLSYAVVQAVSAFESCKPMSLPVLFDVLDPDALDSLFASFDEGATGRGGQLTFVFSNSLVTVTGEDTITVEPYMDSVTPMGEDSSNGVPSHTDC